MNALNKINQRWLAIAIILFFGIIYSSISLYNHYNYRTFAYDLGIKNQVIWDYAHFRMNYNSLMPELHGEINVLANHFEPILFLIAPFYYIFGSYTLLIFQIAFILFGGWGIYRYLCELSGDRLFSAIGMAMFYGMWGIFGALSFDFHTNVIAAVMVPWIFYGIQRKKRVVWVTTLCFILFCKENMALWMVFMGLGIFFHWLKDKKRRNIGLIISAISGIYFLLVMKYAMPFFAEGKLAYMHFKYSALGSNWTEALQTVFTRPGYTFKLLFEGHSTGNTVAFDNDVKWQLHTFVLLSGGVFLVLKPQFLIMLIPIYAQKMFSDDPVKWSIFQQYSIEFVPIIVLAAFTFINKWENAVVKILAGLILFLAAFDTTKAFSGLWKPLPYGKVLTNFYQKSHYSREINTDEIQQLVKKLPKGESVSATFFVVPHIANRKKIYQFPEIKDANYILTIDDNYYHYPLDSAKFRPTMDSILATGAWSTEMSTPHGLLLKRK